jgi:hypothetical protein
MGGTVVNRVQIEKQSPKANVVVTFSPFVQEVELAGGKGKAGVVLLKSLCFGLMLCYNAGVFFETKEESREAVLSAS